jgi:hypoxanthine phosphoribosyltransferase
LLDRNQIQERVRELAARVDADYPDGTLYLVGILKGSCLFLADLARAIRRPVRLDFMGVSSYAGRQSSSGEVKLTKDLDISIEGADVLVVEDIVDTGITLSYLIGVLQQRKPRSVRVIALLDKPERRQRPVEVDYVGFQIPNRFVVGYGLDFAEEYRGLPDVCVLDG